MSGDQQTFDQWMRNKKGLPPVGIPGTPREGVTHHIPLKDLLTSEENNLIVEQFDVFDRNQDGVVTLDEVRRVEKDKLMKKDGSATKEAVETAVKFWLKFRDLDRSKTVDWEEYLSFEALDVIMMRSSEELEALLDPDEVKGIKEEFDKIDLSHDGLISFYEMKDAMTKKYTNMVSGQADRHAVECAISAHINELMKADVDGDERLSWDEYRRVQTKWVLARRAK